MENSIEEDIKIIKDFILKTDVDYSQYDEQIVEDVSYKAIQHLLSAYQEVLKENAQLKEENNKLKYKIKGQECVIETQVHNEEVYESIFEKLEKENKELKKQVKSDVNTIYNNYLEKLDEYERNTIQIQRIKDKIEQLEKNELFGKYNFEQIKFAVDALQELLEGRK